MPERSGYSLDAYGAMLCDGVRMDAYAGALRRAVAPGAVVVDIGTGPGALAVLACRYGARTVYAIETSEAIESAREIARANGVADRIRFIQARSTRVSLPEAADVVVSDLRGVLPLFQDHLPSVVDARRRFLKPGGVLIPRSDVVWMAIATAPELYEPCVTPWERRVEGIDLRPVRPLVTNTWRQCRARPSQLLVPPRTWATLDYPTLDHADVRGEVTWTVATPGLAHGLVVWFDTDLGDGVTFSNAPGAPEAIYGQAFFPWSEPVALDPGASVRVGLTASLAGNDYVWSWTTRVAEAGGAVTTAFAQSTFFGAPLSPLTLARRAADHVPALSEDGRLDLFILRSLEAGIALGEIAHGVVARFPSCGSWSTAMARVADLSVRYAAET